MPFISGVSTCAECYATLYDDDETTGLTTCSHCTEPEIFYHDACVNGRTAHTCGYFLQYHHPAGAHQAPAPGTGAGTLHQQGYEYEPTETVPTDVTEWKARLYDFLWGPPDGSEWVYQGYRNGGHQLYWTGTSKPIFGDVPVRVTFHIHYIGWRKKDGTYDWKYGGAWLSDVDGAELYLNEDENAALRKPLEAVVYYHWTAMLAVEHTRR